MMFSIPDFLDRAKHGAGVDSDYALAKTLGVNKANVSNWRLEKVAPDERSVIALCKLSGDDPEHVAACIQSMRAANDDAAHLWRRVADRLKGSANVVAPMVIAAVVFTALPDHAQAQTLASPVDGASLYIMSNYLWWLLRRLLRLADAPHALAL